ncbi:MAG: Wzz/FepE/Etk N-terminal domain-containing protein, partial [Prevotella sp.]
MDNNINDNTKTLQEIDIRKIIRLLIKKKILLIKVVLATAIISMLLIICVPRYYTCEVMLAPEITNMPSGGTLSSLASSFGFDIGSALSSDAISPTLYPDLLKSNDFLVSLFPIKVTTSDGELTTDYYDYLNNHQQAAWWNIAIGWVKNLIKSEEESADSGNGKAKAVDPFHLTKRENDIASAISGNINCSVDKKTDVITIILKDQDKLICATMADSIREKLQYFITEYRTKKSRIDE